MHYNAGPMNHNMIMKFDYSISTVVRKTINYLDVNFLYILNCISFVVSRSKDWKLHLIYHIILKFLQNNGSLFIKYYDRATNIVNNQCFWFFSRQSFNWIG